MTTQTIISEWRSNNYIWTTQMIKPGRWLRWLHLDDTPTDLLLKEQVELLLCHLCDVARDGQVDGLDEVLLLLRLLLLLLLRLHCRHVSQVICLHLGLQHTHTRSVAVTSQVKTEPPHTQPASSFRQHKVKPGMSKPMTHTHTHVWSLSLSSHPRHTWSVSMSTVLSSRIWHTWSVSMSSHTWHTWSVSCKVRLKYNYDTHPHTQWMSSQSKV